MTTVKVIIMIALIIIGITYEAWILLAFALAMGINLAYDAKEKKRKEEATHVIKCPYCDGTGWRIEMVGGMLNGRPVGGPLRKPCSICNGTGYYR